MARPVGGSKRRSRTSSEERYRLLFHNNPLPMWVYDQQTLAFLDVNEAAVRHYGYSREEFLAMTLKEIRPPEDVGELMETVSHTPGGLHDAGVWRHRRKDGSDIMVAITRHRLTLDDRAIALVLAHDVTEQLAAARALKQSEDALRQLNAELELRVEERTARFRAVAETATDAIVLGDHTGNITYFNPAAERIFGYSAQEAVGQPLTILMPATFHDSHRSGFERYLRTGEARVVGRTVELTGVRRDGTEFPLELSLASWRTTGGQLAFTGILRDISDRKRAEAGRAAHASALDQANIELQAVNRELEAFSYSVSHDLRAPLRAIDGFSKILIEDHGAALNEEAHRLLDVITGNTRRMAALIDDLLAFSRLGRQPIAKGDVDMTGLVHAVASDLRADMEARGVQFVVDPLPPAWGDQALLRQVWSNVLGNAAKFTRRRTDARIEVGTQQRDDEIAYYVRDNGVGFDMRYADKLFGVFQRLHSSEEFEGTGVGLAIVQRVVHRHGGRAWAEGRTNEGATIYFSLPRKIERGE
jgi:PAS domain S-box-containing protein